MTTGTIMKRSVGGMLSGGVSVILKTGLNLLIIPVVIRQLGLDAFGLYLLLISMMELTSLLDLGLTSALVTLLGGESSESPERKSHLAVGNLIFLMLSILFLVGGVFIAPHFGHLFHIQPAMHNVAETSFLLMVPEAALMIYSCYARSILLAHCSHQWTNLADTIYSIISSLGALLAVFLGYGLVGVMAARLLGGLIRVGMMSFNVWKLEASAMLAGFTFRNNVLKELADGGAFKRVFSMSGHAMMLNVSVILSHKIDDVVIARYLPLSAIGIYEIVFRLLGVTIQVGLKLSEGGLPLLSRMAVERRLDDAKTLFLRMSSFLYVVSSLMILAIVCHYPIILHFFSGHQLQPYQTWTVMAIAIPCVLSGVLQMPANAFLFSWGHRGFLTVTSLLAALGNIVLSLLLVQKFGVVGVALGTLIPQLIQHQLGLVRKACQEMGVSFTQYMKAVHGAIILPLALSYSWILLFSPWVDAQAKAGHPPIIPMGLATGGSCLIGFVVWFALTATDKEWEMLEKLTGNSSKGPLLKVRTVLSKLPFSRSASASLDVASPTVSNS